MENFSLTSVNFLSSFLIFSIPFSTLLITFLWSWMTKFFSPSIPNESNNKSLFEGEFFRILHQCVTILSDLSVFAVRNGYFYPGIIFSNEINLFISFEGKTPRKFSFKSP